MQVKIFEKKLVEYERAIETMSIDNHPQINKDIQDVNNNHSSLQKKLDVSTAKIEFMETRV